MSSLPFKPKQASAKVLEGLSEKARDILTKRFGLGEDATRMTLEAIGDSYGITRERVRQIENFALASLKKSVAWEHGKAACEALRAHLDAYGRGVAREDDFLAHCSPDPQIQNHIHFFLTLGDEFTKVREDDEFHHRWVADDAARKTVEKALASAASSLDPQALLTDRQMIEMLADHLGREASKLKHDESVLRRWLLLSKKIGKNPLGDWGRADSSNIHMRGVRDAAFLVLRKRGAPMHFSEVAKEIEASFGEPAHVATCHNELIKDKRFVLVGRGLYGLAEWGYRPGTVREILSQILRERGPLTKEQIIERALKERLVKASTVAINLQHGKHFKKTKDGKYTVA